MNLSWALLHCPSEYLPVAVYVWESDSESVFSDFSYDSQDTGTDVSDAELETKCWTIQPKEDAKVQESKKNK